MSNYNLETIPEYKQVCENINPLCANIIFSYLTEIKKEYYSNDVIKDEIPILNIGSYYGKKHGIQKIYFPNGKLNIEISFINGIENGTEIWYYQNGNILMKKKIINGDIHGIQTFYYENGSIMKETPFKEGKVNGIEKEYYKSGSLKYKITFCNDIQVNFLSYPLTE
jgi:antitoxin component YwqK of YwqJK toxin-antitoxin module